MLWVVFVPIITVLAGLTFWDPFKVFFNYQDYYTNNIIANNREHVCYTLLNQQKENSKTNYIIGNSRSQAFKCAYWSNKISQHPNKCFHYDGSSFGIFRTANAIEYLSKKNQGINNILLIIDNEYFRETSSQEGYLFIQHPKVSNSNLLNYYWTFLKASLNLEFITYYLIYITTGNYFSYMGHYFIKSEFSNRLDSISGDIWYGYDQEISKDSLNYYKTLNDKGVFYKRDTIRSYDDPKILNAQLTLLKRIQKVIIQNHINIKIVISPLYNQKYFNPKDKQVLMELFGEHNIFDFSGQNKFTNEISNYYETSHFRPHVANAIMDSIYSK